MAMSGADPLAQVAAQIAKRLISGAVLAVSTGAGISRESGIPTFRGVEGLWRKYRAEEMASLEIFRRDPEAAWEFHDHLRKLCQQAAPNAGHLALAHLEAHLPPRARVRVITQNIDRLHEQAGSRGVLHLHGDCLRVKCTACAFADDDYPVPAKPYPPRCQCGAVLRPDIVLFGEPLPEDDLDEAFLLAETCAVLLVVGTSVNVQPAASLPFVALNHGALVVEINPEETLLTRQAQASFRGTAATVLPQLAVALLSEE